MTITHGIDGTPLEIIDIADDTGRTLEHLLSRIRNIYDEIWEADVACEKTPSDDDTHVHRADLHYEMEEYGKAGRAYRRALEIKPQNIFAVCRLGHVLYHKDYLENDCGPYPRVEAKVRRALEIGHNDDPKAMREIADLLSLADREEEAEKLYCQAQKLDLTNSNVYLSLSCYTRDWSEEVRLIRRALELDPANIGAHVMLSNRFLRDGHFDKDESLQEETIADYLMAKRYCRRYATHKSSVS